MQKNIKERERGGERRKNIVIKSLRLKGKGLKEGVKGVLKRRDAKVEIGEKQSVGKEARKR